MPRKGASRTPALELPTMQAAVFMSSEKWANRIEGRTRKRSPGRRSRTAKIASAPGSLLGAMMTKGRPEASSAPKRASAWAPIVAVSEVTGWKTAMPCSSKGIA
jgi:hypothetical protein